MTPLISPRKGPIVVPSYANPVVIWLVRLIYCILEPCQMVWRFLKWIVPPISRWCVVLFVGSMLGTFFTGLYCGRFTRKTLRFFGLLK